MECKPAMRRTGRRAFALMVMTGVLTLGTDPAHGQVIDFIRQFGSPTTDMAHSVAVDATGVYVVGVTVGTLPGQISSGIRRRLCPQVRQVRRPPVDPPVRHGGVRRSPRCRREPLARTRDCRRSYGRKHGHPPVEP